jgi:hypothetical protein
LEAILGSDLLFSEINTKTLERYKNALESVAALAESVARMPGMATVPEGGGASHPGIELMLEALEFYEFLFSTYIGYENGRFIQIVAVRDKPELRRSMISGPGANRCGGHPELPLGLRAESKLMRRLRFA